MIDATPARDANGHRVWSEADVEVVAAYFDRGRAVGYLPAAYRI
jgi:hypothetical protein